jgi:hypothetical protein
MKNNFKPEEPVGTYLGTLVSLQALRDWCRVCEESKCWRLNIAANGKLPRAVVRIDGKRTQVSAKRAGLVLAGNVKKLSFWVVVFPRNHCKSPQDCVNPDHNRYGSRKEMGAYYSAAGTYSTPARIHVLQLANAKRRKISLADRIEIERSTEPYSVQAKRLGVSPARIGQLKRKGNISAFKANSSVFNLGG